MLEQNTTSSHPLKTEPTIQQDHDSINLLNYLEVIASNWSLIIKVIAAVAIVSLFVSLSIPNRYIATARILPPQQDSGIMGVLMGAAGGMGSVASDLLGKNSPADMYIGILNSDTISDNIIDKFKLMEIYNRKYRLDTYVQLNKNVDIIAGKKDGIISISVEDKDPTRAAAMANEYVEELSKLLVKLNITGANQNQLYLEERLAKAKIELVKAEDLIKAFQSQNKALDFTEQTKGTIKGLADLEAQLALEEVKLSGMRRVFTDTSQEIKNQRSVIHSLNSQIAKFEGTRPGMTIPGIGTAPETGQQYIRLMREFKIQEALVETLTKQNEAAKLAGARDVSSIQLIQSARVPDKKSKPKRTIIVLMSSFLAGIASISYAFLRDAGSRMQEEDRTRIRNILSTITFNKICFKK